MHVVLFGCNLVCVCVHFLEVGVLFYSVFLVLGVVVFLVFFERERI